MAFLTRCWPRSLQDNSEVSLRDVQHEIIEQVIKGTLYPPFINKIRLGFSRSMALCKDAEGSLYNIKSDDDWHLAQLLGHLGRMVGGKGFRNPDKGVVPKIGYYVSWEKEDQAREYYLSRNFGEAEF